MLSLLFFGAARLLGFTDLPQTAPELSAFVVALNLSVPMAVWMRFRGMEWRPRLGTRMPHGVSARRVEPG
ncbi:hypothetical protein [Jiangella rhizosphaerae]|uniref:hypothetical protein n=1 Tax=Jiangella rhizosphaerae TaxID=2293569 RepID=UPI0011C358F4|nr:hypothetical protein [Jiangella rhizosphaerae]